MKRVFLLFLVSLFTNIVIAQPDSVQGYSTVFDLELYESVLDPVLCEEQIRYIQQSDQDLLFEFFDAGARIPKGILTGNTLDLGNYYQCLGINQPIPNSVIEGKYCMINLPLDQTWPSLPTLPEWPVDWPDIDWPEWRPKTPKLKENIVQRLREFNLRKLGIEALIGVRSNYTRAADSLFSALNFRLGVCIPKTCSTRTALSSFFNGSRLNLDFEESYCRLPNDKPWVAGDYVAVSIFSLIGLLVVLSTAYDLWHNVYLKKDLAKPRKINKLYVSFSVYTNTRRLVTYVPVPGSIECLDGIRTFAMIWIIIGHSFATQSSSGIMGNSLDALNWMLALKSVWITAAPISVDTFFMLSGLLLVYTTAGKLTGMKLLKNLHLFYLNRILRMFPVLAAMILLQISILNRVADGPYWAVVEDSTNRCRNNWWATLLYIQNFLHPLDSCLGHAWYLAIDVQLHILSPIILFWVLTGKRRLAWTALLGGMVAILTASTIYSFIMEFPGGTSSMSRPNDSRYYIQYYYVNTMTRASPFFVGLIFGYILHLNRGKKVVISMVPATIIWACAIAISAVIVYCPYPVMQFDWDNQFADNMINSFMRPAWAMFVGWVVFACVHGYAGPVNWFLCLRAWKVISRLSYGMYLAHYPLMFVTNAMPVTPIYFTFQFALFQFLADLTLATSVAFLVTVMIDSPFSVLVKHFLGPGPKRAPPNEADKEIVIATEENKPDNSTN